MEKEMKKVLFPLYKTLMNDVSDIKDKLCPFAVQWGEKFDTTGKGILFVGKASNGWVTTDRSPVDLFDEKNEDRIFNRDDQITTDLLFVQALGGFYNLKLMTC